MYTALYRKYRPQSLKEVVGQSIIKKTLLNAINNNKLSHAYLFCGPRGTGKTSIAKLLGKLANCESPVDGEPCNNCVFCTQYNDKQVTDIIEIDAASNNGVDEIREIRSKVNLVPTIGKYKIYIIDEVHMLTTGAFNALLKTLEEPPSHIIFILATTEPHKIPNTILSRCQRFDFKKISETEIFNHLSYIVENENINCEDIALKQIANISQGGMRDAIGILDQVIAYAGNIITIKDVYDVYGLISDQEIADFIKDLYNKNVDALFLRIEKYNDNGKNFVKIISDIILFFRNILLYKNASDYLKENCDVTIFKKIANYYETSQILDIVRVLNISLQDMKNFNNPKLVFELATIQLLDMTNKNDNNRVEFNNNDVKINNEQQKTTTVENLVEKSKPISLKDEDKKKFSTDNGEKNQFIELKKIRVNNTLAELNKKVILDIKTQIETLKPMLLDPNYSELISLLLDGNIKAASEKYIIFVFNNELMTDAFNSKIYEIENILNLKLEKKYRVIAVDFNEWNIIKDEFNSKIKKYEFIEEKNDIIEASNKVYNNDPMVAMFGEIVEYN